MLTDAGASAVILGHSERRADHGDRRAGPRQDASRLARRPRRDRLRRRDRGRARRRRDARPHRQPARRLNPRRRDPRPSSSPTSRSGRSAPVAPLARGDRRGPSLPCANGCGPASAPRWPTASACSTAARSSRQRRRTLRGRGCRRRARRRRVAQGRRLRRSSPPPAVPRGGAGLPCAQDRKVNDWPRSRSSRPTGRPPEDISTIFGSRGEPYRCQCQWFKIAIATGGRYRASGRDGSARRPAVAIPSPVGVDLGPRRLSRQGAGRLVRRIQAPHYLSAPAARVPWIGRSEDPADPGVWAVTCFVTRAGGFSPPRGRRALARAANGRLRERGARRAIRCSPSRGRRSPGESSPAWQPQHAALMPASPRSTGRFRAAW